MSITYINLFNHQRFSLFTTIAFVLLTSLSGNLRADSVFVDIQKLLATGNGQAGGDDSGWSVAISGSRAIVGAPRDQDESYGSGSVYIYERDNRGTWHQAQKLTPSISNSQQLRFGGAVAISGNYAVVGFKQSDGIDLPRGINTITVFERNSAGFWEKAISFNPVNTAYFSRYGGAIAISGRSIIVGDANDPSNGTGGPGSAYIYERISGTWKQTAKLNASDATNGDNFGWSVGIRSALTISGNYAVVGAPGAEKAYMFIKNQNGDWVQEEIVTADDGFNGNQFGYAVAVSGATAIVGAIRDDENGSHAGAAYVYDRISSNNWQQKSKLTPVDGAANDFFGASIAISGGRAVVGTALDDRLESDDTVSSNPEAAYVFERTSTGAWVEWSRLSASDSSENDDFGSAVAISGDWIIAGAHFDDDNGEDSGSNYFFTRGDDEIWRETQKTIPQDGAPSESFGVSARLDGDRAIISGRYDRQEGSLFASKGYIFERDSEGIWQTVATLVPPVNDSFYWGAPHADISGDWAVFGVPGDDDNGNNAGAVYLYKRESDGSWPEAQKLKVQDGTAGDFFGERVAISGDRAIFTSRSGSAYVFEIGPGNVWVEWAKLTPGDGGAARMVAIEGDRAFVGDSIADGKGAVYVFERDGNGAWTETQKLTGNDTVVDDGFGIAFDVEGSRLVVGAFNDNDNGEDSGSVYVFERNDNGFWQQKRKLLASDGAALDDFGWDLALSGERMAVATLRGPGEGPGAVYLFRWQEDGSWLETDKLMADRNGVDDFFGVSVSLVDDFLLLGDLSDHSNGLNAGAALIYEIGGEIIFESGFE